MIHEAETPEDVWYSYFKSEYKGENYSRCSKECEFTPKSNELYVYDSSFIDDRDGAISVTKDGVQFLHSSCIFDKCYRSTKGGAIYFECKSSIVQRRFRSTNASTDESGFHSFTDLVEKSNNDNLIEESTICLCSNEEKSSTIFADYGKVGISSSNITKNNVEYYSGFDSFYATNLGNISFSTFEDNHAKEDHCLGHGESTYRYFCCNMINNSQDSTSYGVFYINSGEFIIENSVICGDYGNGNSFYCYYSNDKFTIVNCNIDPFSTGNLGTYNITQTFFEENHNKQQPIQIYSCQAYTIIKQQDNTPVVTYSSFFYALSLVNQLYMTY